MEKDLTFLVKVAAIATKTAIAAGVIWVLYDLSKWANWYFNTVTPL